MSRKALKNTNEMCLVWFGTFGTAKALSSTVCRTFVELNLGSTHVAPSESDVVPVSLQSRTYSIRFGTWKVRPLKRALQIWYLGSPYVNCYSNLVSRSQKHELISGGIPLTKILKFDGCYEYDRNRLYIFC